MLGEPTAAVAAVAVPMLATATAALAVMVEPTVAAVAAVVKHPLMLRLLLEAVELTAALVVFRVQQAKTEHLAILTLSISF